MEKIYCQHKPVAVLHIKLYRCCLRKGGNNDYLSAQSALS